MNEMTASQFRTRVDWLSTGTVELGYVVHATVSVSTTVHVNQLPPSVWAELATDPDPMHLSVEAREDLALYLTARAKLTRRDLEIPGQPAGSVRREVHGTSVDVLEADVYVQTLGDALADLEDLDLQALPDSEMPSPEGDTDTKES